MKCTALKSAGGHKTDPTIARGVKWLLGTIGRDYEGLLERVNADVAEQKAEEERKRRERTERVKRLKEERER